MSTALFKLDLFEKQLVVVGAFEGAAEVGAIEGLAVVGEFEGDGVAGALEGLAVDDDMEGFVFCGAAVLAVDGVVAAVVVGDKVVVFNVVTDKEIVCWEVANAAMMHALLICPAYATWQQINWVV